MVRSLALPFTLALVAAAPAVAHAQAYPGGYPGPGGYAPPPTRQGLTFEANLGFGLFWASSDGDSSDKEGALGGLDLGIGTFVNPRTAITARIAGVTYSEAEGLITEAFFGPSVQYFVSPNAFVGGGLGLGVVRVEIDGFGSDSENGLALDLRAGYTFDPLAKHSFNVSVEYSPAFVEDTTWHGFAILGGYQFQ